MTGGISLGHVVDAWSSPFRWYWQTDNGEFEQYPDDMSLMIEKRYSQYLSGSASHVFETSPIVRYVDDRPQQYRIDFKRNLQINSVTGFERSISRKTESTSVPLDDHGNDAWSSPFRWYWQTDNGEFEQYPDDMSLMIEKRYSQYLSGSASHVFETSPIVRYVDDRPQQYRIDFKRNLQINSVTSFERSISRKIEKTLASQSAQWQCQIDGEWRPFEFAVQSVIERAYQNNMVSESCNILEGLTFPGRPESYSIDFVMGRQINERSGTRRNVRRVPISDFSTKLDKEEITIQFPEGARRDQIDSALKCINDHRPELDKIVRQTSHGQTGSVSLYRDKEKVILKLEGVARALCSVLIARIHSALHKSGISMGTCVSTVGLHASKMIKNPRLMQLLSPQEPIQYWQSRDDAVLLLAHSIIWTAKCSIYGGFIRDWVIRGEGTNDIDVLLPDGTNTTRDRIESIIRQAAKMYGIQFDRSRAKGLAYTLVFRGSWREENVEVDLVKPNVNKFPPFVDCDVGNFLISAQTGLVKKSPNAGGSKIGITDCIRHCEQKQFVFFYDTETNPDMCRQRLKKYLSRGWQCLSPLPSKLEMELSSTYRDLLSPQESYAVRWWQL